MYSESLYGNGRFLAELENFTKSGKLPQAIIIEGEAGLGKHVAARLIAAAAVCEESDRPCGHCKQCRLALAASHPDVRIFSPTKSTFRVETARELRNAAYLKPLTSDCNVSVLEHCELMNAEAQNALLKVLEEPPSSSMFILLTENAGAFLPTVISRCTLMRLSPVSADDVIRWLSENTDAAPDEAYTAAALANGNIGKALLLLESEDSAELKRLCDEMYGQFVSDSFGEMAVTAYAAEKSSDPEAVIRLLADRFFGDLKNKEIYGAGALSHAVLSSAHAACVKAIEALSGNGNKSLTLTLLCSELRLAKKI